ncbi:arabinosyltransferase domain-containing protein [Allosaccharopolyspora coralli]|uniref:arabinosyltransferase domain-containing protein n=1 Tax=Allosaccharopolyspora coralli TaxID=2665642 RepID=UPI002B40157B|nr:arabinosyltransferase domain-containing protein [Allosaccharopolyspora coralli]
MGTGENSGQQGAAQDDRARTRRLTTLKLLAVVAGVLGTLLALIVPFLPVNHDITTLKWPTAQGTQAVSAPLVNYTPLSLDAEVPCATARDLDARTPGSAVLVSTNPPDSKYGTLTGLTLQVEDGRATLVVRGQQLGSAVVGGGECAISLHADGARTTASLGDQTIADVESDIRPQLTGIFSDIDATTDDVRGLSFAAEVDDRYQSYATPVKLAAIGLVVLALAGSLVALRRVDTLVARRPRKFAPTGWWRLTSRDVAVLGALVVWWLIGAMTADDGYFLTMARVRDDLGYVSDFYRWFAVAVAPMGWFVDVYSWWVQVSTATPWVRLPALAMGAGSWLLISREVLPRLGPQVRRSSAAGWAAGAVFLAFWLPYNNGLRPEPIVVLLALLAWCAVERSVAAQRLAPAAVGLVVAALSIAANPHGAVAVLPFLAAIKPLSRLVAKRAREFGWLPVLAPIAAHGFAILALSFSDQTWQSVRDATASRREIGPNRSWFEELHRYTMLFSQIPDGSLTRRFPVLLVVLCLAMCLAVLLRRGKIQGAALGPSRRLLAVTVLYFVVLALTPTKHTHHFGVFAAVGGALAALTALATSSTVLRSARNRAVFFAGLMLVLAFAMTGTNAWWYVSGWGVPWFDTQPTLFGYSVSTLLLGVAAIALVIGFVEHLRLDEHNPKVLDKDAMEERSRALRRGTVPLSLVCALLMVGELATFAKVIQEQKDSYSLGMDNIRQLFGDSCGLSDYVWVEGDPRGNVLSLSPNQPTKAAPGFEVPESAKEETPDEYLRPGRQGFVRNGGLPPGDGSSPGEQDWTPPHQYGGGDAPTWGSYGVPEPGRVELRTQWFDLPESAQQGEMPVVLSVAGWERAPNSVFMEFGRQTPQGFEMTRRHPVVHGFPPAWREQPFRVGGGPGSATKVRVVARDRGLGPHAWMAVSAPRVPELAKMSEVVGDSPTFVEWPAALVHPCARMTSNRNGIAQMPRFRIAGGGEVREVGQAWSSPDAGGPFGWLSVATSMQELPTYLEGDIGRDWGSLYRVDPYEPDALPAEAAMEVRTETHWGTWSPGPLPEPLLLPGDVPNSDDRTDIPLNDDSDSDS